MKTEKLITTPDISRVMYFEAINALKKYNQNVTRFHGLLTQVITEWNLLSKTPLTFEDLQNIIVKSSSLNQVGYFENAENLLKNDQLLKFKGLPLDPQKLRDMVTVPNYGSLESVLDQLTGQDIPWSIYTISDGKVMINETELEQARDSSFRNYTENPEDLQNYNVLLPLVNALNTFASLNPEIKPYSMNIHNVITLDDELTFKCHTVYIRTGSDYWAPMASIPPATPIIDKAPVKPSTSTDPIIANIENWFADK